MQGSTYLYRMYNFPFRVTSRSFEAGFTIIELMIVIVIAAIGVALAVPSFSPSVEKRQLVSAAEQVVSFMEVVQGEAIKRNAKVTVSWYSPGGHNANWCIGASLPPKTAPCDCRETVSTEADFCSIDSVPYRLVQSDFTSISNEFMHMWRAKSSFSFDPVRGIVDDIGGDSTDEQLKERFEKTGGDWLFYVHTDRNSGSQRLYELQMSMNATGRSSICAATDRSSIIGGYPQC